MSNIDKIRKQDVLEIACMMTAIIEECRVNIKLNQCEKCKNKYCTVQGMIDYLNMDDGRDTIFT